MKSLIILHKTSLQHQENSKKFNYCNKKDLQFPYNFKKSIYFDDDYYRDNVHNEFTFIYQINNEEQSVVILGVIKNKLYY